MQDNKKDETGGELVEVAADTNSPKVADTEKKSMEKLEDEKEKYTAQEKKGHWWQVE